ncbi:MAG: glycosyltransferase family 4 protein, partial [Candidatus Dormibacteraceae bacterium]
MVHYAAPPVTGGVESVLGAHARLLRRAGHDVLVIAGRGEAMVIPEIDSRHPDVERVTEGLARGDGDPVLFERLRSTISDRLRQPLADRELTIVHNVLTMPLNLPLTAALLELTAPAGPA